MKKLFFTLAIGLLFIGIAKAQDFNDTRIASHAVDVVIPDIAVIDIEDSQTGAEAVTLTLGPSFSGEAGRGLNFNTTTNTDLWMNYTSVLATGVASRAVTVEYSGTLPAGVELNVLAAAPSGSGVGGLGTANGSAVPLLTTPSDIVTLIESGYTGDGANNGHNLTYNLTMDNASFDALRAASSNIVVTYTMVDR